MGIKGTQAQLAQVLEGVILRGQGVNSVHMGQSVLKS